MVPDRSIPVAHRLRTRQTTTPALGADSTQLYLFEALRELAFENCLDVAGNSLRFGLAVTQWQLEQAFTLLNHFNTSIEALQPPSEGRVVGLALHAGLTPKTGARAKAVVVLRRDGPDGLALDALHPGSMEKIREHGGVLVEVEQSAFTSKLPIESLLMPMVNALAGAVRNWGATDIVAECPREQASLYCGRLGFRRVHKRQNSGVEHILLHLSADRIQRLHA